MAEQFGILVRIAVLVVATLLPLINPAGSAAIFHSMTLGISDAARRKMAWQIGLDSFFLVVAATFIGFLVERLIRDEPLEGREREVFVARATAIFETLVS